MFDLGYVICDLKVNHWLDGRVMLSIRPFHVTLQDVDFFLKVISNKAKQSSIQSEESVQNENMYGLWK